VGYWVASSGNVADEVWAQYIKNQTPPEPDDDFKVTRSPPKATDPALSRHLKPPPVFTVERNG
jgi:hypothetical protein